MSLAEEKKELRRRLKELRASIPEEERRAADRKIIENIVASPLFRRAKTLLIYAPREDEIRLFPLASIARKRGMRVAFPICDPATERMEFRYLEKDQRLHPGAYGIPEPPKDAERCIPDKNTLCILPALAMDVQGTRIGYGKGYYDRFLADFPGMAVCAIYEKMLQRRLPREEHDRPIPWLCTERGIGRIGSHSTELTPTSSQNTDTDEGAVKKSQRTGIRFSVLWKSFVAWLTAKGENGHWKYLTSPVLFLAVFLLLLLLRPIGTRLLTRGNEYLIVVFLQLLIFVLPALIYCKLKTSEFPGRLRMRLFRPQQMWFCFCVLVVMITGALLMEILTGGIRTLNGNFTLYDTFVARTNGQFLTTLYVILAYSILPAFAEELLFRTILCADFERCGVGITVLVSGLFFAFLHFDLQLFLTYFLIGILLSAAMYITRSFFAAFLLHLFYNLFCLFGQPYLSNFYITAGSHEIFLFCVITLCLLFAAFATGEARKILHLYARRGEDSSFTVAVPRRQIPGVLKEALLAPAPLACALLWLTVALVRLF